MTDPAQARPSPPAEDADGAAKAAAAAARAGTVLRGKWQVDALIGIGGMAAVYSATHRGNGRRAALKILHAEFARDAMIRERFLREAYVGNKIPHAGRVEVFDDDVAEDGAPFLVMELLEGETLAALWKRLGRRLPVVPALDIAEQLLDFLSVCHGQGIVHRDLKPANIVITHDRTVKVLDFGVAQLRDSTTTEHTRAGTALGTPSYMSPEQARGLGDKLDGRADLFSVGAILYALLSGKRLNSGRNNDEALIMAATQPASSVVRVAPDLPVEVIALVDKALAWDRRARFADAAEMRTAVLAALEKLGGRRAQRRKAELDVEDVTADASEQDDALGAAAPAAVSLVAAEDDPAVERLRSIFRQVERVLPSVRQYGWSHPETERKLRSGFEEIASALAEAPDTLHWAVRPYSFAHRDREIWEPTAPLDTVPYGLFEAGVREMRFEPGFAEAELRRLLGVMLIDPATELAPEDDLATVLWELELPHVRVECADGFAEGGAAAREAFFEEADRIEALADRAAKTARAEARAMSVQTDRGELAADPIAASLAIDPTTRVALATALAVPTERWTERYVDALVDALVETKRRGDLELVLAPLAASAADMIVSGRASLALSLHGALREVLAARVRGAGSEDGRALAAAVGRAMFGGNVLPLAIKAIEATREDDPARAPLAAVVSMGLAVAPPEEAPRVLAALPLVADERLRGPMLEFLVRSSDEAGAREIAKQIGALAPELARAILAALAHLASPTARAIVVALTEGGDPLMRLEAVLSQAASTGAPDAVRGELARLVDDAREDVRLAVLRAIAARGVKELGPLLVRRIEEPSFHGLSTEERHETLRALFALHPTRAEQLVIELLSQRQVLKNEARDRTRAIAAELLGEHGTSAEAMQSLAAAAKGWWGISDELKAAAQAAAKAIEERRRAAPGGRAPGGER
jgi:hypothetical protein